MSDTKQDLLNLNERIQYTHAVLTQLRIERAKLLAGLHVDLVDQSEDQEREYDEAFEGSRR